MNAQLIDLGGRRAVVTGGSRGIGRAVARMLGRAGADVGIAYRSAHDAAEETVAELEAMGRRAWAEAVDLSGPDGAAALFERCDREFDGLDIVVGNAGIWPPDDVPLAEMSDADWARVIRTNLDSIFYTCRAGARRIAGPGKIVLVGSTAGQRGEAGHAHYAASKGAINALVKSLALELAPKDIQVNAVAPGWVDTDMAAPALDPESLSRVRAEIPLGRIATPDDIAGPIVFLCSDLARHITGEILNVNGGSVRCG